MHKWLILAAAGLGLMCAPLAAQAILPMPEDAMPLSQDEISDTRRRAEAGDADAQRKMAQLYFDWAGTQPDYVEAAKWLRLIDNDEWARGRLNIIEDFTARHRKLFALAQAGDPEALYAFAHSEPHMAIGLEGDQPGHVWLLKAARAGHAEAQLEAGQLYWQAYHLRRVLAARGQAATKDEYRIAKTQRHPEYVGNASLEFEGERLEADVDQALHWFHLAADQGQSGAAYMLGLIHAGPTVPQDMALARRWLYTSKDLSGGYDGTVCRLEFTGRLNAFVVDDAYRTSLVAYEGVPDYGAALPCYESLAQPAPDSDWALGYMYMRGLGTAKDPVRAAGLLTKALRSEYDVEARFELGRYHRDDPSVRDLPQAYRLMSQAIGEIERGRGSCARLFPVYAHILIDAERWRNMPAMKSEQAELYARMSPQDQAAALAELNAQDIWPQGRAGPPMPGLPCV